MLRRRLIVASVATTLGSAGAMAQPVEPWDIAWLEAETRQLLDLFRVSETEFTVSEIGDGYLIQFPSLVVDLADATVAFSAFDFTLSPQGDRRTAFDIEAASPTLTITDAGGRTVARGDFTDFRIGGVWSSRFREPLSTLATLDGFTLTVPDDGTEVSLGGIRIRQDLVQAENGRWDSEEVVDVRDIEVTQFGRRMVTIEAASVREEMRGYDVETMAAFRERYDTGLMPVPMDPAFYTGHRSVMPFFTDLIDAAVGVFEDASVVVTMDNIAGPARGTGIRRIDNMTFAVGYEDFNSDAAAVSVDLRFAGVVVEDPSAPPHLQGYVPDEIRIAVAVEQLPVDSMLRTVVTSLRGVPDPVVAGTAVGPQLILLLLRQDITLRLRDHTIEAPDGAARANAVVQLDPMSALGTTAHADFTLVGLDQLIDRLRRMGVPEQDVAALTILQAMGRPGAPEDGGSVRRYIFEQTAAGDLRLNGVDLWPLLTAGGFE